MWNPCFILSSCIGIWFTDIFDAFERFTNIIVDRRRSSSMIKATVLVLISVTDVLGLQHCGALWTDFQLSLTSLCHFSMLKLLRHWSPKVFFSNAIVSLSILSSQMQNSTQMCCLVFEFIFLQLEQHFILCTLFLYQCMKTMLFIVQR